MKPLQVIGMTIKRLLLIHKNQTIGEVIQACLTDLVGGKVEVVISILDGLLFLKPLKSQPETQGIPVMLLTLKAKWSDLPQSWFHKSQLATAIVNPLEPTMLGVKIAKVLG